MNWKGTLLKIGLGVVIFISLTGIVLGLSILFGMLKKPMPEETPSTPTTTQEQTGGVVYSDKSKFNIDIFPHETKRYKAVFTNEKIVVYLYPDLFLEGVTIEEQIETIKAEVKEWLDQNGIDAEKTAIEWRTK